MSVSILFAHADIFSFSSALQFHFQNLIFSVIDLGNNYSATVRHHQNHFPTIFNIPLSYALFCTTRPVRVLEEEEVL